MCALLSRTATTVAAGTAVLVAALLTGCSSAPAATPADPYAKVAGAAVGAAADPATLSPPGLPAAADFGAGWSGPGADGGDETLSSRSCGVRAVEASKLAAGNYDGPSGVKVNVYTMHAAAASVDNWLTSTRQTVDRCLGSGIEAVQPLPAVDGHPTSVGMRVGTATTWWAVGDSDGYAAVASVTVPESAAGSDTDVWAAGVALSALRAAAGGPATPVGAPPAGGGDLPAATETLPEGWQAANDSPVVVPRVAGGGEVTLPDGTRLSLPEVPRPAPAPQPTAVQPGDSSVAIGGDAPALPQVPATGEPQTPDLDNGVMPPWDGGPNGGRSQVGPVPGATEYLP